MDRLALYSWGANSHGQLGLGDIKEDEVLAPRKVCVFPSAMRLDEVIKMVGGAGHTLFLDQRGQVFSCGWNDKGQAGVPTCSSTFQKVEALSNERITDVACGWDSSMALTREGDVFVWGSNSHGQLGLRDVDKVSEPRKLVGEVDGRKFQRISMGLRHSAIVSTDGELLVSGASNKGQLGVDLQGARCSESFLTVSDLPPVREVACAQHHTVAISRDNQLFAWGDNKHGQLGIDPQKGKIVTTAAKVENGSEVNNTSRIYCGWTHTCLYSSVLYSWGRNSYGQLARPKDTPVSECWKAGVALNDDLHSISVGSEHNMALTGSSGTVLAWGWNEHGNCGTGSTQDVFRPTEVKLPAASLIGTGAGHSFALVYNQYTAIYSTVIPLLALPCRRDRNKSLRPSFRRETSSSSVIMFRARSQSSIGDSEREAKFVQERIDAVEKHFAELCSVFAAYTRKAARLRDKNDEVAKTIQTYADAEDINRSMSTCLVNFANTLSVVGDYSDAQVQRLNSKVVAPLSQYQNTCKRAKENVKSTFAARDEELKRKRMLEKVREENPKNQQRISQAKSNLMKATVEVSRVVKGLEEQIDSFEKQKLHDIKTILLSFVTVQLSFHAKAVELLTKAYQDVAEIDEAQDLEEFRETMKATESSTKLSAVKKSGFRQACSLMNLHNRFSPSPSSLRKGKAHKTTESLDSSKTGHTNSSESVQVEEYDESTDDSEESSSIRDKKSVRSRLKTM
ncbi:uncharacterized protein LOC100123748 [Nasonia vitripennis]|uniref:RCC1-like domain-containing protein n=1 Tax=Nasonia vitripennis TaxID=7425 RepID=A0A7M7H5D2_NASVI|nr:uncharacterized protein LOC100123748 [Nasonia vitripennis]